MQKGKYVSVEINDNGSAYIVKLLPGAKEDPDFKTRLDAYLNNEEDLLGMSLTVFEGLLNPSVVHPMKLQNFEEVLILGNDVEYDDEGNIDEKESTCYFLYTPEDPETDGDPIKVLLDKGEITVASAE